DFLGKPAQAQQSTPKDRDDAFARHWLPEWTPHGFLTKDEIRAINAQLAHLAARRQPWNYGWPIEHLAGRCGTRFEEFASALEAPHPARAEAFETARFYAHSFTISSEPLVKVRWCSWRPLGDGHLCSLFESRCESRRPERAEGPRPALGVSRVDGQRMST